MFGSFGKAVGATSLAFVSKASLDTVATYGLSKNTAAVQNCRTIGKKDMQHNDLTPNIHIDPETYQVTVDGETLTCEPAAKLPLAQLYNLF